MARRTANARRPDLDSEQRAVDVGRAKLDSLVERWSDADSDLREQLFSLVDKYKATCRGMATRRAQIIQEISAASPIAGNCLEKDKRYHIAVPERTALEQNGVIIAYFPDEGGPAVESSQPRQSDKGHRGPTGRPLAEDVDPLATEQLPTNSQEELALKNEAPVPDGPPTAPLRTKNPCPGREGPLLYSSHRSPTRQPPIQTSRVANYWVFDYAFNGQVYLFVMRCPAPGCEKAIFTHHPLKRNRAADHFRACGIRFKNERDMVQRYARQVITGRKGRVLRYSWAWMHNHKLLSSDEAHLEEENLSKPS